MNLGDPELEFIDPTPNVHALFIQFDKTFFWARLASRAVVRWSKRMYSCAGICSYEGSGGLCDIALSEPLLKLRPRKDLVETLLHEMIHAYLFITQRVQDRDGHGPNFKEHMFRINKAAGINISIYHDFHDEVQMYQTHWWRCDGPCQFRKPHYGIVRRPMNSAPGPRDYWWADHQRKCGGTFIKFKEPEKKTKKTVVTKPPGDITKYITNSKSTSMPPLGEPKIIQISDIISKSGQPKSGQIRSNNSNTVVVTQKPVTSSVNAPILKSPSLLTGTGYTLAGTRVRTHSVDASEKVRNIWAKKQLTPTTVMPVNNVKGNHIPSEAVRNIWAKKQLTPNVVSPIGNLNGKNTYVPKPSTAAVTPNNTQTFTNSNNNNVNQKASKHKTQSVHADSPPVKVKKIDDYFKINAASLLKDIYGTNIEVAESNNNKLVAVNNANTSSLQVVRVDCPICRLKFEESKINSHLDECLNKDIIAEICNGNETNGSTSVVNTETIPIENYQNLLLNAVLKKPSKQVSKEILSTLAPIPAYKPKVTPKLENPEGNLDYSTMNKDLDKSVTKLRGTFRSETKHCVVTKEPTNLNDNINWNGHLKPDIPKTEFDPADVDKAKEVVKKVQFDKHLRKSDKCIIPKEDKDLGSGYLPSFVAEDAKIIQLPPIKIEPGTSVASSLTVQKCPCCGNKVSKPIGEHLDECLAFFATDEATSTSKLVPEEGTSFANHTIIIDEADDDIFDESQVFNATGTKLPCPCCLEMVENDDMNAHLDRCLS